MGSKIDIKSRTNVTDSAGVSRERMSRPELLSTHRNLTGMRLERFNYGPLDLVPQLWIRLYDQKGKVVEESLIESDGELVFRWIYLYDERGRKVQGNLHNSEGRVIATSFYDEHQTAINRVTYNSVLPRAA